MFHHSPILFLATSWDPIRNITYALLHCAADPDREYMSRIKSFLTTNPQQASHPILLPVLIMDLETDSTLLDDEGWTSDLVDVERETGQRAGFDEIVDLAKLDLPSIVKQMNACSQFVSLVDRESEAVLHHLRQAREAISDIQTRRPDLEGVSHTLTRHVEFLIESRKGLLLRLQNIQRRSQIQLAYVCSSPRIPPVSFLLPTFQKKKKKRKEKKNTRLTQSDFRHTT